MAQALELRGHERVLEVGTGSGYGGRGALAALRRGDHDRALREPGRARRASGSPSSATTTWRCARATARSARPDRAPFDGISVTASAADEPPPALLDQLAPARRLVCPVERVGRELLVRLRDGVEESLASVRFVPLIAGEARPNASLPRRVRPQLLLAGLHRPAQAGPQDGHDPAGEQGKKYRKGEVVMITVGFQHSPRERIFEAVIDSVDVKKVERAVAARHRARQPGVPPARRDGPLPRADLRAQGGPERRRDRGALLPDLRPAVGDPRAPAARTRPPRTSRLGPGGLALWVLECQARHSLRSECQECNATPRRRFCA